MNKSKVEAEVLIEDMACNNNQWLSERNIPRKVGVYEIYLYTSMASQIATFQCYISKIEAKNEAMYATFTRFTRPIMS